MADDTGEPSYATEMLLTAADTRQLLQSRTFHRAVRTVHKKVHELQHGKDVSEMGGTKIDSEQIYLNNTNID